MEQARNRQTTSGAAIGRIEYAAKNADRRMQTQASAVQNE
jgi:hypothetical protein